MRPTPSPESGRPPPAGCPRLARGEADWRSPVSLTGLGGLDEALPLSPLRSRGLHLGPSADPPSSGWIAPSSAKAPGRARPNPGKSDQIAPNPTCRGGSVFTEVSDGGGSWIMGKDHPSDQIQVNRTKSNRFIRSDAARPLRNGCGDQCHRTARPRPGGGPRPSSDRGQSRQFKVNQGKPQASRWTVTSGHRRSASPSLKAGRHPTHSKQIAPSVTLPDGGLRPNPTKSHQIQVNPT